MVKPHTQNFIMRQAEILRLKATDDGTGQPMSHETIGKRLGLTKNAVHYYIKAITEGRCKCCLRKLDKPQ